MDFQSAKQDEVLEAILAWSAIPGASRHHWGTEFDIFDASVKSRTKVELTQRECREDFQNLYSWLDKNLRDFPFHRPYVKDLGGVGVEPWHLSYTPLSKQFEEDYTLEVFERNIQESELLLKDSILESLEDIYERYVANTIAT